MTRRKFKQLDSNSLHNSSPGLGECMTATPITDSPGGPVDLNTARIAQQATLPHYSTAPQNRTPTRRRMGGKAAGRP